ncbi:MAG: PAS domain S-box protein [Clostridiales bacterium]|nr:PAS domain S-box protein [Clostridiales bacterium]
MKIRTRMTIGLIMIILLIWGGVFFSVSLYTSLEDRHKKIDQDILNNVISSFEYELTIEKLREWSFIYILRGDIVVEGKPVKDILNEIREELIEIAIQHDEITDSYYNSEIGIDTVDLKDDVIKLVEKNEEVLQLKEQGVESEELMIILDDEVCIPLFTPTLNKIKQHKDYHLEQLYIEEKKISISYSKSIRLLFLISSLCTVILVVIVLLTRRAIIRPLYELQKSARIVGSGNLNHIVGSDSKDEIGQLSREFDKMTIALSNTLVSKDYIESVVMSMNDSLIVLSKDLIIQKINPSTQNLLGYEEEELIDKSVDIIFGRKISKDLWEEEFIKNSYEGKNEIYLSKDGNPLHVLLSCSILLTEGRCEGFICVAQNFSLRKMMEERLKESVIKYSSLFMSMTSGFVYCKVISSYTDGIDDFQVLETNDVFQTIAGIRREDVVGQKVTTILRMLSEDVDYWMDIFKEVAFLGSTKKVERYLHALDKWLSVLIYSPQMNQFALIIDDITNRKESEMLLQQSNDEKTALLAAIPAFVFIKDLESRYLYGNQKLLDMLDIEHEDLIGKTDYDIFPKELASSYTKIDRSVIETDKPVINEDEVVQGVDGNCIFTYTTKVPLRDSDGHVIGIVGTAFDISTLKKVEAELIEAKQHAEEANQEKTRFLANMSHEIRTPMNGIIGMTNLISKMTLNEKQAEYLLILKESSEALLEIINNILDISKIEAGKIELENSTFKFPEMVNGVFQTFSYRAIEKKVEMIYELDENIPEYLNGDSARTKQVLRNLLSNALKFTEKGHIILKVNMIGGGSKSVFIDITVKDTGIGISDQNIERIFESFTQSDISTTRKFGGTGLGLNITKNLVDLMGGSIDVKSVVGVGSDFRVVIPFTPADENEIKMIRNEHNNISRRFAETKLDVKVLIAEDNYINQIYITELLKIYVNAYTVVSNGAEAVEKYEAEYYDCILMDMQMPIMDGANATKKIRRLEKDLEKRIPIIALTASALKNEVNEFMNVGIDDYIIKPLNEEKLISTLESIFKHKISKEESDIKPILNSSLKGMIDLDEFWSTFGIFENQFVIEMVDCFFEDYLTRFDLIEKNIRENDVIKLKHNMHNLKGVFANFRANKLKDMSSELDLKASNSDTKELYEMFSEIKKNVELFVEELKNIKASLDEQ